MSENKNSRTRMDFIFDYGGTLDTNGNHWGKVIWHAYKKHHVPVSEEEFREAYVFAERTLGKNNIIKPDFTFRRTLDVKLEIEMKWLVDNGKWNATEKELTDTHDKVLRTLYDDVCKTQEHSREVLEEIASKGSRMVLVSNFYGNVGTVLREFHLDHLFTKVIESAAVGIRKPDPRIFELGIEALGAKPEDVIVVGDSLDKDIIPAKSLGCKTVWFKGEQWKDDEDADETVADKIINDLALL